MPPKPVYVVLGLKARACVHYVSVLETELHPTHTSFLITSSHVSSYHPCDDEAESGERGAGVLVKSLTRTRKKKDLGRCLSYPDARPLISRRRASHIQRDFSRLGALALG